MGNEFYTLTTLGTLAGASGATVAVTNALKNAVGISVKWLGLLVAQVVCLGVLAASGPTHASDWFIAILNGFLVYATAAGATSVGAAATGSETGPDATARSGKVGSSAQPAPSGKAGFWSPWF